MALKVDWADEATGDLDQIIKYLESNWTEDQIHRFFVRLENCLSDMTEAPHRQKDSLRKEGTKEYQHSPQTTIFYSYDPETVYILRVWVNLKDPDAL